MTISTEAQLKREMQCVSILIEQLETARGGAIGLLTDDLRELVIAALTSAITALRDANEKNAVNAGKLSLR